MAIKKNTGMAPSVEDLLVTELTVGGDVLDRAFYWTLTKDLSDKEMESLQKRVRGRVEAYYNELAESGLLVYEQKRIDKLLGSWFRPWTRLAGRMEDAVYTRVLASEERFDERAFSEILIPFSKLPEYAPFLDREFAGFAVNKCVEYNLDYSKLDPVLQVPEELEYFRNSNPFLVESETDGLIAGSFGVSGPCPDDVAALAASLGDTVDASFDPGDEKAKIGLALEIRPLRYLRLSRKPVIAEGQVDGVLYSGGGGKFRAHAFISGEDGWMLKPVKGLEAHARRAVLESMYWTVKAARMRENNRQELQRGKFSGVKM